MKSRLLLAISLFLGILTLSALVRQGPSLANTPGGASTRRVSVASDGTQADDDSNYAGISADGSAVAFISYATNLVPGDTNGVRDVFVHHTQTGITRRVSVASDGSQGNARSGDFEAPGISADGRYVAFVSIASNLVISDTNSQQDVFVHDLVLTRTVRVSVASDGSQGSSFSAKPAISADGRFVAFVTASTLVPGDTNGQADVFVHDRDADQDGIFDESGEIHTVRVSVASDGSQATGSSGYSDLAISDDGRHISFDSYATNLVPGDTNSQRDTFVHDRDSDQDGIFDEPGAIHTARVSVATDGTQGDGESSDSDISGDGRYVAFWSQAGNLVPGDTNLCEGNSCFDIFVHDRDADSDGIFDEPGAVTTSMVSVDSNGIAGDNHSYFPAISADGRYIAFYSLATNLVPGDSDWVDIFVHDRQTGETVRASITNQFQQANGSSFMPSISGDGQWVVFDSVASNLVGGDTNGRYDIFLHDRLTAGIPTPTPTNTATPTQTPTPTPVATATPGPPGAESWQTQSVDVRGRVGEYAGLALDSLGRPHISYHSEQGLQGGLKYAYWDGLDWRAQMVEAGGSGHTLGEYSDLVLDGNDRPHITYYDRSGLSLKLARWTGSAWDIQVVASGPLIGPFSSLQVSALSGLAHIVYYDGPQERLLYARPQGGGLGWIPQVIDESASVGLYNDLAMDSSERLQVSYYDADNGNLKFASYDPGTQTWTREVVDSVGDVGRHTSLTIDSADHPHISYYDVDLDLLKYAHHDGSGWTLEFVNINGEGGRYASIALDAAGTPYISYQDSTGILRLAVKSGASWAITTVDAQGDVGQYSSLALDAVGTEHIAYYDKSYGDLKYATYGPAWQLRTIAAGGSNVSRPSLALHDSRPGISYHTLQPGVFILNYATWTDNAWSPGLVALPGTNQPPSSLAYDSQGKAQVAYYSVLAQGIMYNSWDGSVWNPQVAVPLPQTTTLANDISLLDENGVVAIVFVEEFGQYPNTSDRIRLALPPPSPGPAWTVIDGPEHPDIGRFSAGVLGDGRLAVSYYEASQMDLRVAVWDGSSWSDVLVDGSGDAGRYNALATGVEASSIGTLRNFAAVAYYDADNQRIKFAHDALGGWGTFDLILNVGDINSLDLALAGGKRMLPFVAFGAVDTASIILAFSNDNLQTLTVETIYESPAGIPSDVALAHDGQPHLAFRGGDTSLVFTFPTARDAVPAPAPVHASSGGLVGAILGFDGEFCLDISVAPSQSRPTAGLLEGGLLRLADGSLSDAGVMQSLTNLFDNTPAGQAYIDLYVTHAAEMTAIAFSDPGLLWDSYRTLHNFMPGLEALVSGSGSQITVTQQMADNALDIWNRLAAAGGLALAGTINSQLVQYNNLQDFVGLTFDEWVETLGVQPPAQKLFLPAVPRGAAPSAGNPRQGRPIRAAWRPTNW